MMKDLRAWYTYIEEIARKATSSDASPAQAVQSRVFRIPPADELLAADTTTPSPVRRHPLPIVPSSDTNVPRRPGRRPLTETREEIILRLLDPEMTLHEAAALLNLSKATVRRYTTIGKLHCSRTAGGQRRFRLSDLLTFLEAGGGRRLSPKSKAEVAF